jgi:hypothetical protein
MLYPVFHVEFDPRACLKNTLKNVQKVLTAKLP